MILLPVVFPQVRRLSRAEAYVGVASGSCAQLGSLEESSERAFRESIPAGWVVRGSRATGHRLSMDFHPVSPGCRPVRETAAAAKVTWATGRESEESVGSWVVLRHPWIVSRGTHGVRVGWGAAFAVSASTCAAGLFAALQADSDGAAAALPAMIAGGLTLAVMPWPMLARAPRVPTLAVVLAVAQILAHVATLAASGVLAREGLTRRLLCCPPAPTTADGPLATLTAHAGIPLLAVQLVACLLLAAVLSAGRRLLDLSLDAVEGLLNAARPLMHPRWTLLALAHLIAAALCTKLVTPLPIDGWKQRPLRVGLVLARSSGRRGPPGTRRANGLPLARRVADRPCLATVTC